MLKMIVYSRFCRLLLQAFVFSLYLILMAGESCAKEPVVDELVEVLREELKRNLNTEDVGAGYVALLNFAFNPDISAATYYIDGGDDQGVDARLNVYRLPIRHLFLPDNSVFRPFIQLNLAYQTYGNQRLYLTDDESIGVDYQTFGGSATFGLEVSVFEGARFLAGVNSGLAHLENRADYNGEFVNTVLKPAYRGIIFDWDADAWLAGALTGVEYRRSWRSYELRTQLEITYNHFETYRADSRFVEFDADATTCSAMVESIFPMPFSLGSLPLAMVMNLGRTSFHGSDENVLGFSYFYEAGLAFEVNIAEYDLRVNKLSLGTKFIAGRDVAGWSLILGYRF